MRTWSDASCRESSHGPICRSGCKQRQNIGAPRIAQFNHQTPPGKGILKHIRASVKNPHCLENPGNAQN
jgi:hypothetical protein